MGRIINMDTPKKTKEDIKQRNLESYGNKIKKYRINAGITAEALATKLQVSLGSVRNWECGLARPDPEYLTQLFTILDVEPNEFFGLKGVGTVMTKREKKLLSNYRSLDESGKEDMEIYAEAMSNAVYKRKCNSALHRMDVVNNNARHSAAGDGTDWPDHPETIQTILYKSPIVSQADEIITVTGKSMEPQFHDGDRVLVKYCTDLRNGDIGIFYVPGIGGVIKQKAYDRLHSLNPDYDDIFPYEDGAIVVGRVLGIIDKTMVPSREEQAFYMEALEEKEKHPEWFE